MLIVFLCIKEGDFRCMDQKKILKELNGYFESAIKSDEDEEKQYFCFKQMLDRDYDNQEKKKELYMFYKLYKAYLSYQEKGMPKYDFGLLGNIFVSIVCGLIVANITKESFNLMNCISGIIVGLVLLSCPIMGTKFSLDFLFKNKEIKREKFLYFVEKYLILTEVI
jgi:hypothetical protein